MGKQVSSRQRDLKVKSSNPDHYCIFFFAHFDRDNTSIRDRVLVTSAVALHVRQSDGTGWKIEGSILLIA